MKRNIWKILGFLLFLLVIVFLGWYFLKDYQPFPDLEKIKKETDQLSQIDKKISTPEPLESKKGELGLLTKAGVVYQTNQRRKKYDLPLLEKNTLLEKSALKKARDILKEEYFAHQSPSGKNVDDLAEEVGYQYLFIGENLAKGNFSDDKDVVTAWMNSEGHRENILNKDYQQIGVAVLKGEYRGQETWVAVQHFGTPLSVCPQPSSDLKNRIKESKDRLENLESRLDKKREEIENTDYSSKKEYNEDRQEYNELLDEYNRLDEKTSQMIDKYNNQVNEFNQCVNS